MESIGLVLTGRDKVRINEPFASGQNNMLNKTCVCSLWALCPQLWVSHFCACGKGQGDSPASQVAAQWLPQPIGSQMYMATGWAQRLGSKTLCLGSVSYTRREAAILFVLGSHLPPVDILLIHRPHSIVGNSNRTVQDGAQSGFATANDGTTLVSSFT